MLFRSPNEAEKLAALKCAIVLLQRQIAIAPLAERKRLENVLSQLRDDERNFTAVAPEAHGVYSAQYSFDMLNCYHTTN